MTGSKEIKFSSKKVVSHTSHKLHLSVKNKKKWKVNLSCSSKTMRRALGLESRLPSQTLNCQTIQIKMRLVTKTLGFRTPALQGAPQAPALWLHKKAAQEAYSNSSTA